MLASSIFAASIAAANLATTLAPPAIPLQMRADRAQTHAETQPTAIAEQEGPTLPAAPEPDVPVARENLRMVIAGDVLVGAGMGGFGVMVAGLAIRARGIDAVDRLALRDEPSESARADAEARVELGNQLALGGGIVTAVLVSSGITLIAIGNRRERKRRAAAQPPQMGAWSGRDGAGLTLRGQF